MIDQKVTDDELNNNEAFDETPGDSAFQLEKLQSYPTALPYDTTSPSGENTRVQSDEANIIADPGLISSLKDELERGRIQKAKGDNLDERIRLLREQLRDEKKPDAQQEPEADDFIDESIVSPADEHEDFPGQMDLDESPTMLGAVDDQILEELPLVDVDVPEPPEIIKPVESTSRRRFAYGIAAVVLILSVSAATFWWWQSSQNQPADPALIAVNSDSANKGKVPVVLQHDSVKQESSHDSDKEADTKATESANIDAQKVTDEHTNSEGKASLSETQKREDLKTKPATSPKSSETSQKPPSHVDTQKKSLAVDLKETVKTTPANGESHKPDVKSKSPATQQKQTAAGHETTNPRSVASHSSKSDRIVQTEKPTTNLSDKDGSKLEIASPALSVKTNEKPTVVKADVHKNSPVEKSTAESKEPKSKTGPGKQSSSNLASNNQEAKASQHADDKNVLKSDNPQTFDGTQLVPKPVFRNVPTTSKGIFSVHIYSSPSREDAEEWMGRLKDKNVDSPFITKQNIRGTTYYRVRFGSFATKEEAENAAVRSGFASGWVDRVK